MIISLFCCVALLFPVALAAGEETCEGVRVIDASLKGSLYSPMYDGSTEYPSNLHCWYRIKAPSGHRIKITFKDFDVAPSDGCGADQLGIHQKRNQGYLGTFCGNEPPRPILSLDNELNLLFRTDFLQGGRGFHLEYESGPDMQLCDYGQKECKNRNCYKPKKECDGVDDCGDGTDEEFCSHTLVVNPKECGTPEIDPRVNKGVDRMVGGEEVVPNSWPWQVSLQSPNVEPNAHFCGGTLINTLWVLTATHCVDGKVNPGEIKVVLGSHGKFTKTRYQQVRYSARVVSYPELLGDQIKHYKLVNDMSLIRLQAPVILNPGVHPACLPHFGYNPQPGWECYATGWGETRGSGFSHALKQTFQTVMTQQQCRVSNQTTQVCVGNSAESACHGDSGGPLQCKVKNKWYVMGAASFVTTSDGDKRGLCVGPNAFTVYATTAFKYDWVHKMILKYTTQ